MLVDGQKKALVSFDEGFDGLAESDSGSRRMTFRVRRDCTVSIANHNLVESNTFRIAITLSVHSPLSVYVDTIGFRGSFGGECNFRREGDGKRGREASNETRKF